MPSQQGWPTQQPMQGQWPAQNGWGPAQAPQQPEEAQMNPLDYLSQAKKATPPADEIADDEYYEDEEDEDIPAPKAAKRGKKAKKAKRGKAAKADKESKKRAKFQELVNRDDYYSDRFPIDNEEGIDGGRNIQWVPLILGGAGILIFAYLLVQLQSLIM